MKRFLCGLLALCSLFTAALADRSQQLLWAEEMAQELDIAAGAKALYLSYESPAAIEIMTEMSSGDHSHAAVIYCYTLDLSSQAERYDFQNETVMQYAHMMVWNQLTMYGLGVYENLSDEQAIILTNCSAVRPFAGSCGNEVWILSYWNGADIMVTFMDQGNGTVLVSASYLPYKRSPADMMHMFEEFGITATYEKIR